MEEKLWQFSDNLGSFSSELVNRINSLYFPLANENILSSITPDLHGDIKSGQDSFLLEPATRIGLVNSRSSRNFWVHIGKNNTWSATGVSKDIKQIRADRFSLQAGLLWHRMTRENKKIGLKAEILSFVPSSAEPVEVMQVKLTNTAAKKIRFTPFAAIPIYARGADSLRDHRHVTSLLQRITLHKFGLIVKPTLVFDERGHRPNKTNYFVLGWDQKHIPPEYIYPTQEVFCGESGDLEAPLGVLEDRLPDKNARIQGKEPMGALRFRRIALGKGESRSYTILSGINEDSSLINGIIRKFRSLENTGESLAGTKKFWTGLSAQSAVSAGDSEFDNWFRWVSIQPTLRRLFGCSFLPDFDYGKGGRGWRDLWQDSLGLILSSPDKLKKLIVNNFSGVRIDGSNATIIGKGEGEFIADRNDIARVWMDHGIWPLLTLDLYLQETADFGILFKETTYFRDRHIFRSRKIDRGWSGGQANTLKTPGGKDYRGSILEHLLVENLAQFFNVGPHNHIRLEGADWNDGLDMAAQRGESVAFTAMYAQNLLLLAGLLEKSGKKNIEIAGELKILLKKIDYGSVPAKRRLLDKYFDSVKGAVSGRKIIISSLVLAEDLKEKSRWMMRHIRKSEWLRQGFFNGYYDNSGRRAEGKYGNSMRMMLASQVFPIMSGVAGPREIKQILENAQKYLRDEKLKGYRLNTDFRQEQYDLGRAFSFVYGDKENGAFFNHMSVMFAYGLYKQGFAVEGWEVLSSIYRMALDTGKSRIYPCLPEYFDGSGKGMYSYLTGSASWFVLTVLTQAFGLKGRDGDLLIEPKLTARQFEKTATISANRRFAGRQIEVSFSNPRRLEYGRYKIRKATFNSLPLTPEEDNRIVIARRLILKQPANKVNKIHIIIS